MGRWTEQARIYKHIASSCKKKSQSASATGQSGSHWYIYIKRNWVAWTFSEDYGCFWIYIQMGALHLTWKELWAVYAAVEGLFEINRFRTISALSVKSEIFSVMAQRMTSRLRMGIDTSIQKGDIPLCSTAPALFSLMIWEVNINNNDLAVISRSGERVNPTWPNLCRDHNCHHIQGTIDT